MPTETTEVDCPSESLQQKHKANLYRKIDVKVWGHYQEDCKMPFEGTTMKCNWYTDSCADSAESVAIFFFFCDV